MKKRNERLALCLLFVIPAILLLVGIAFIGYSSEIVSNQKRWDEEETVVEGIVEAKGEGIITEYDYGIDMSTYEITDKTMQIKYTNQLGRVVRCIYEKEFLVKENKQGIITFYVDIDDTQMLKGRITEGTTTCITILGGFLILLGFLLATTGLKQAASVVGDAEDEKRLKQRLE